MKRNRAIVTDIRDLILMLNIGLAESKKDKFSLPLPLAHFSAVGVLIQTIRQRKGRTVCCYAWGGPTVNNPNEGEKTATPNGVRRK